MTEEHQSFNVGNIIQIDSRHREIIENEGYNKALEDVYEFMNDERQYNMPVDTYNRIKDKIKELKK